MTYEQAYTRLQEIATQLQDGNLSLDNAVKLFEESITLSKFCLEQLKQTEGKILVFKGELENLKPLDVE